MSQIIMLGLHLDCFDKWEHTKMLQFSHDESLLWASASELFVHAILAAIAFLSLDALLVLDCWEGKMLTLDVVKNVKLHTPWG